MQHQEYQCKAISRINVVREYERKGEGGKEGRKGRERIRYRQIEIRRKRHRETKTDRERENGRTQK